MNKRITFGRRKTDWLIPLGFLAVGVVAAFWASYNRTKKSDIERQNETLKVQVQNLERIVNQYEKRENKNIKPTGPGTPDEPANATALEKKPAGDNTRQARNALQPAPITTTDKPEQKPASDGDMTAAPAVTTAASPSTQAGTTAAPAAPAAQ